MVEKMTSVQEEKKDNDKFTCGIIMPISGNEEYTEEHWKNVLEILKTAIEKKGTFKILPVWANTNADVIQSTIINNIFSCDMVVCDMSSTNPNVMYELGLRMAVKKPIVLVKDEETKPPFDINSIRYQEYPKELHYFKINEFMEKLSEKVESTWNNYRENPDNYTQLIDLSEYKKYIIKDVTGEENPQSLQDAVNSIYQFIVRSSNTTRSKETAKENLTELSARIWQMKNEEKDFKPYIEKFITTISTLTSELQEEDRDKLEDQIEEFREKYNTFFGELNMTLKKIEDVINE